MYNRLRELREDKDLRQADVAAATGIDQRTLSNYETGKTNPDSYAIIKLADFFDVSTDYLLGRTTVSKADAEEIVAHINTIRAELDKLENEIKR